MARSDLKLVHSGDGRAGGPLPPSDGGSISDGMEARVAKLEAHVEHIQSDLRDIKDGVKALRDDARTDFRLLFGALIATTLGLAGLMAKGFGWL